MSVGSLTCLIGGICVLLLWP